jgi:hypothetical protein
MANEATKVWAEKTKIVMVRIETAMNKMTEAATAE